MPRITISKEDFFKDRQGRTFADVLNDPQQPFTDVLAFFNDVDRQRRMLESEIHHDRAPMAGIVRELEAQPKIGQFLSEVHPQRTQRLRQAIGVLVRMIMEGQGWKKTGKKGSLGVRAEAAKASPAHNTGGLAFWFLRAERYELEQGMPYSTVAERRKALKPAAGTSTSAPKAKQATKEQTTKSR
ncbi:MAG: hypothetical protein SH868_03490 [Bythopirellula sp.]|nr:hypothetical protein [Bythopirellula sp.]